MLVGVFSQVSGRQAKAQARCSKEQGTLGAGKKVLQIPWVLSLKECKNSYPYLTVGYYFVAYSQRVFQTWNDCLRQRFQMYIWKQWKTPRRRCPLFDSGKSYFDRFRQVKRFSLSVMSIMSTKSRQKHEPAIDRWFRCSSGRQSATYVQDLYRISWKK